MPRGVYVPPGPSLYPECSRPGTSGERRHWAEGTVTCAPCRERMRRKVIRYRLKSARLGKRQVPAIGTHRRIQALNRWGWTRAQIGERMGVTPSAVTRLLEQQVVFADTAARVTKVFDTLVREGRPGTSTKTRERAIRAGWGGPLDWDEGNIEDPQAVPIFLVEAAHAEAIELHKTFVKRQRNRVRSQAIRLAERSKPRVLEVAA